MNADRVRSLFVSVLDLDAGARSVLLREQCVSEEERKAVLELLSFDCGDNSCDTLGRPISELRHEAGIGRFGPYEIQETIGRGGMGAVYRAERVDGEVRQVVAIKLIEREWQDQRTLDRFRRERQILSGLAHPNITRLLDTGTREDGRPYLVMEFIEGEPLDEYCRKHALSLRDRLSVFLPICRAVEYAHSKLVIHRDLKPSNVLVTAEGEPKLLDFGIARALDEAGAESTNTLFLTPQYASPDLARGEPPSTAMDIYGLGAVLYFLLTESAPHRVEGLSPIELVRHLSDAEPAAPSTIRWELRGDLENIIRKAMHLDPHRRYGSARELADDIERYLALRPVRATPDRPLYRAGRFLVRRRWLITAASVALAAVAAGTLLAWTERRRADEEAAIARAVSEFLQKDLIGQAGLRSQIERGAKADADLKVRTILDRAAASVPDKFLGMPKVEAAIRIAIGGAYRDLGLDEDAQKHYRRAFELRAAASGKGSADTLEAANLLGETLAGFGKTQEAEAVYREMLASASRSRERRLASAQARYGIAMAAAAKKLQTALPALKEAIGDLKSVRGSEDETVLTGLNQLAVLYLEAGQADEAEKLFREILETRSRILGPLHPDTLASMSELGNFCFRRTRFEEARELLRRSAEGMESVLGPGHPVTLAILNNLPKVYIHCGDYAQAIAIRLRILEGERKLRGPDHPATLVTAGNLAGAYRSSGNFAAAVKLGEDSLEGMRRVMGPENPQTLLMMRNLAISYREAGRLADSARLAEAALRTGQRVMGFHVDTASFFNELARTKKELGDLHEAERLFREALGIRMKFLGPANQHTLTTKDGLATVLQAAGRHREAELLFNETVAAQRKLLGENHAATLQTMSGLAALYRAQNRLAESAALLGAVLDARRKTLGSEHPDTLRSMRDMAALYRDQKRFTEAQPLLASLLRTVTAMEAKGETIRGLRTADLRQEQARAGQASSAGR
ncbi:MAG: serine/threonine protein kinase [Acidobacteria bacterium]|nr:serine/threonine protein kinase [Acidobacteriota bacterium]